MLSLIRWFTLALVVSGAASALGAQEASMEKATFAAGCFWGVEKTFQQVPGVVATRVGYTGGKTPSPTYEEVCSGLTGHAESIEITFDPSRISYDDLLTLFFEYHDPTTLNRQGPDMGTQYRSAIFYHNESQKSAAEKAIQALTEARVFRSSIVTQVVPASTFWSAEEYHQKYLRKNPLGYCSVHLQSRKVREILGMALRN